MKRVLIHLFLLITMSSYGQEECFFLSDLSSNTVFIIGKYSDLIEKMGQPDTTFSTNIGVSDYILSDSLGFIIERKTRQINAVCLIYGDSLQYLKIGDSVQLSYAFVNHSNGCFWYKENKLDRKFSFRKASKVFHLNRKSHEYDFEEYYYGKNIKVKTFGIRTENSKSADHFWFVFFRNTGKLWYLNLPLQCKECLIR